MKTNMSTKVIFCANCQEEKPHELGLAPNGEITATCSECERVIKFPAVASAEQFNELVAKHKTANEGQVSIAKQEAFLASIADSEPQENENQPQS